MGFLGFYGEVLHRSFFEAIGIAKTLIYLAVVVVAILGLWWRGLIPLHGRVTSGLMGAAVLIAAILVEVPLVVYNMWKEENTARLTAEPQNSEITVSARCDVAGAPAILPPEGEMFFAEINEAAVRFGRTGLGRVWGAPGTIAKFTQESFVLDCRITNDSAGPIFNLTLNLGLLFIEPVYVNSEGTMKYGDVLPSRKWDITIDRIAEKGGLFRFYVDNFTDTFVRVSLPDDIGVTYKNKPQTVKLIKSKIDYFELFPRAKGK